MSPTSLLATGMALLTTGMALLTTGMALCALTSVVGAQQQIQWQIPERGAVFYTRKTSFAPDRPRPAGFGGMELPAILFQAELDERQQFVAWPPSHLRDLAAWLAFDLRLAGRKGRFKRTIDQLMPHGSIHLRGEAAQPGDDGVQRLTIQVWSEGPIEAQEPPAVFTSHFVAQSNERVKGNIEIERRIDAAKGLVTSFTATFTCEVTDRRTDKSVATICTDAWSLQKVETNRYPAFVARVAAAIGSGAKFVLDAIKNPDQGNIDGTTDAARTINSGRLALCLLTVLKCGVPPSDPVVQKAFDSLRRREVGGAYSVGIALMAFEALYAPGDERRLLIEGRIKKPLLRKPSPEDRALMEKYTRRLLTYVDIRVRNQAYTLRFSYMPNQARFDNSCSQYVVLGLYSASLCGIDIPPTTWYACANHWNDTLLTYKGLREPLRLVSHGELARIREQSAQNKDSRTVVAARRIQVGGWAYLNETVNMNGDRKQRTPATASMTCAGITGAWISAAALRNRNIGKPQVIKLQRSAQQGFAWLHHHFDVRHNHPVGGWYYYYMYGLERAAELAQVALIGNRDWYFEGAEMLLGLQGDNGGFRGQLEDACFAILFLKQAAPPLPALTGK